MSLISYYPLNGNGKDIVGSGATLSCNYNTFNGETVASNLNYFQLSTLNSDFTISYDLYRHTLLGYWCTDFGLGYCNWSVGSCDKSNGDYFIISYFYAYGYPNLGILFSKNDGSSKPDINLNIEQSKTIKQWIHTEIHRNNKEFTIIIYNHNGDRTSVKFTVSLYPISKVHFFNAGGYQTGGGYFKNLKIYNSYMEESLNPYHYLYQNNDNVYI